ncbi:MAG TPA: heavy metal translocating P-type ATPase [Gemmatimonadaceae bacterium]
MLVVIAAGGVLRAHGDSFLAEWVWLAGLATTGAPVVWRTLRGALRGHFASDVVAMLAVVTALVMQQPLAGLIVVLMQTGGESLERFAEGRASEAVRALEEAAPRLTTRLLPDGTLLPIAADEARVGELLLVRPGEMVPCDGQVVDGHSLVDTSRLTGEPLPVSAEPGTMLLSGVLNGEGSLTLRVLHPSRESQYARIVELVRTAQESKAPLQRLADRYAVWFTPLTLVVCALAWWITGDSLRVLAVLVVATPCPLILATPVAIIGGINRAARAQVIVRHGTALEQLATTRVVIFDKTGTLTEGHPRLADVRLLPGVTRRGLLADAGAVEQRSSHLLARALVAAAEGEGIAPPLASSVREHTGRGVSGVVEGRAVAVGSRTFMRQVCAGGDAAFDAIDEAVEGLRAYVAVDGHPAGIVIFADHVRSDAPALLHELRALGVQRTVLLSGDRDAATQAVAHGLGIDEARGDLLPGDKVEVVRRLVAEGGTVVMMGDGTNDAPALSAATVGVALSGHGGGITAEAADVVILVDRLQRLGDAVRISARTLAVAKESIWVGLGLSGIAMVVAAAGYIPPTVGALLQEGIDVAVIINALRTSRAPG